MAVTSLNIARVGVARVGLARLNYGTASYDAEVAVITTSGSAGFEASYTGAASGFITLAGSTTPPIDYTADSPTGGATLSGSAPFEVGFVGSVSGGALTAGDSVFQADYIGDASGTMATAGDAQGTPEYIPDADGFITTDGTAPVILEFTFLPSGEALSFGESFPLEAHYIYDVIITPIATGGETDVLFSIDKKGLPVFLRKFDGDVRLSLSLDGGLITIWAGQPEMDGGLETAVNISLFTESGWWGNSIIGTDNEVGSEFEASLRRPLTNQSRLSIIEAGRNALQWMLDTGIAEAVEFTATIPAVGRLDFVIKITQPEKTPVDFRYNVNWANQKIIMTEAAA